jgi:hypothetical protein
LQALIAGNDAGNSNRMIFYNDVVQVRVLFPALLKQGILAHRIFGNDLGIELRGKARMS